MGAIYFVYHDVRRFHRPRAGADGWKPAGFVPRRWPALITIGNVRSIPAFTHAAVLAAVAGAVHERHGRHRRAEPGLADDPGDVSRPRDGGRGGGFVGLLSIFNMAGASSGLRPPTISGGATPT
jgi:hypothetical protein